MVETDIIQQSLYHNIYKENLVHITFALPQMENSNCVSLLYRCTLMDKLNIKSLESTFSKPQKSEKYTISIISIKN